MESLLKGGKLTLSKIANDCVYDLIETCKVRVMLIQISPRSRRYYIETLFRYCEICPLRLIKIRLFLPEEVKDEVYKR